MARPSQREQILDAAERVVVGRGAGKLTLDAVAAEAGVGKGGLIYHFPSKQALLKGLIDRMVSGYEAAIAAAVADPEAQRAPLRARARTLIAVHERNHQLATALVAVAANQPDLIADINERLQRNITEVLRSSAGTRGVAVLLAIDGLFLLEQLRLTPLRAADRQRVLRAIVDLAGEIDGGGP